jgi:uracil-DNA glycosylase
MIKSADQDLLEKISNFLHYHESLGLKEYPRTRMLENFLAQFQENRLSPAQQGKPPLQKKKTFSRPADKRHLFDPALSTKATLQDVRDELGDCQRCPLRKTRTHVVFGQGAPSAKLMIVADAPGSDDDRHSLPLQGAAGELLDKMLTAINLARDEIYITTLVKCFPGPQAKPREDEIKTCLPFLFRQIELICPTVICTMGMLSSQTLLHSPKSLFQLRGRFYNFNDLCTSELKNKIVVMPSLYPSLLLENADLKKASWQDLQLIQKKLEDS